ncbi:Histone deacetylase 8 [Balamuthia mandrillaris]
MQVAAGHEKGAAEGEVGAVAQDATVSTTREEPGSRLFKVPVALPTRKRPPASKGDGEQQQQQRTPPTKETEPKAKEDAETKASKRQKVGDSVFDFDEEDEEDGEELVSLPAASTSALHRQRKRIPYINPFSTATSQQPGLPPVSSSSSSSSSEPKKECCYMYSEAYLRASNALPIHKGKDKRVHALIEAYGLLKEMRVVEPTPATMEELMEFHSRSFLQRLSQHRGRIKEGPKDTEQEDKEQREKEEDEEEGENDREEVGVDEESFGLVDDCPLFDGVYDYVRMVAGASLTAAKELIANRATIAINWMGGRHHAKVDEAAGYCYINDIVLSILCLSEQYKRVLYVDIDVHHGDGVEEAFYCTDKVLTLSFHHHSAGYFPGTGSLDDIGNGRGKYYSLNIPLKEGLTSDRYVQLFKEVFPEVALRYAPQAIVMQCGVDGLVHDPLGAFNLTPRALGECVECVQQFCKKGGRNDSTIPLLLLGGGGYHNINAARAYAYLTGLVLGKQLPPDIPEHKYFHEYKDNSFQLGIEESKAQDQNNEEYLSLLREKISNNIARIRQRDKNLE